MGISKPTNATEYAQVLADASAKDATVIVDFTATWCGPCQRIAPFFEALAAEFPHVVFVKVDVDENSEVAQAERVEAMPTFKAYKNRKEVGACKGDDDAQLRALVVEHAGSKWRGEGQTTGAAEASGMSEREKRLAALEKRGL